MKKLFVFLVIALLCSLTLASATTLMSYMELPPRPQISENNQVAYMELPPRPQNIENEVLAYMELPPRPQIIEIV